MTEFILFTDTYDPLTTQGSGSKAINVAEIIHITFFKKSPSKRIKSISARIHLKNREIFDITKAEKEIRSTEELLNTINK